MESEWVLRVRMDRWRVSGSLGWEWASREEVGHVRALLDLLAVQSGSSLAPPSNPSIPAAPAMAPLLMSVLRTRSLSAAPLSLCLHLQNGITSEDPARNQLIMSARERKVGSLVLKHHTEV